MNNKALQLGNHLQQFRTYWAGLSLPVKLAHLVLAVGLVGMSLCIMYTPELDASVMYVSCWASANMLFTILTLSSLVGIVGGLNSFHLKVIDLIWVCASAAGIVFAIIQVFVNSADQSRERYEHQWAESRQMASQLLSLAAKEECSGPSRAVAKGCDRLDILTNALSSHGRIDIALLNLACPPFPINLSIAPPSGYSPVRLRGCMAAYHVTDVLQRRVMLDKENAANWREYTQIWPLLLMFFIALRVSKSVAEVFWKIK